MKKRERKQDLKTSEVVPRFSIQGAVEARKCEHCGHHEIGVITETGDYLPLTPGMKVMVLQDEREKTGRVVLLLFIEFVYELLVLFGWNGEHIDLHSHISVSFP